jgi:hypothetical protein
MKSSALKAQVEEWIYRGLSDTAWATINSNVRERINRRVRCVANMERAQISPTEKKNQLILPSDYLGVRNLRIDDTKVDYCSYNKMYSGTIEGGFYYTVVGREITMNVAIQSPTALHMNYYYKARLLDEEEDKPHTISDDIPDIYLNLSIAEAFNFSFDTPNADKFYKLADATIMEINDDNVVDLWSHSSPAIQAA